MYFGIENFDFIYQVVIFVGCDVYEYYVVCIVGILVVVVYRLFFIILVKVFIDDLFDVFVGIFLSIMIVFC